MRENQQFHPKPPVGIPTETKHGTTTVALKFKNGVIMLADNRASAGYMVASDKAKKLHSLAKCTAMSIAGSVADAQYLINLLRAEINLFQINREREMNTTLIGHLLSTVMYQQYRSYFPYFVGPILAGVDNSGSKIFPMDIAGSLTEEDWASTGSGSPFAIGALEASWHKDMEKEDAIKLGLMALRSAIKKDIATGDGMDVLVITRDGIKKLSKEDIKTSLGDKYPF